MTPDLRNFRPTTASGQAPGLPLLFNGAEQMQGEEAECTAEPPGTLHDATVLRRRLSLVRIQDSRQCKPIKTLLGVIEE